MCAFTGLSFHILLRNLSWASKTCFKEAEGLHILKPTVIFLNSQVFQRRMDGTVNFYRGWEQYKNGFGHAAGEYWLGMTTSKNIKRIFLFFFTNVIY